MPHLAPSLSFVLVTTAGALSGAPLWQPVPPLPVGIAGGVAFIRDGTLNVAGGTTWEAEKKITLAGGWKWDRATNNWSPAVALPFPFAHGVYGTVGDGILLAGGSDGERTRHEVVVLGRDGRVRPAGALAEPMAYGGGAVDGHTLFVLGGTTDIDDLTRVRASFSALNLENGRTESLPDYPGGPVMHARLAVLGEQLLVYPGGNYDSSQRRARNLSGVWSYSIPARRWSRRAEYPFAVRGLAVCALDAERHVLAAGGHRAGAADIGVTAEAFVHDTRTDRYHALPPLPYAAMLMEAVRDGDWVYVLGGEDRSRHRAHGVFRARVSELIALARRASSPGR